MQKHKEYNSQNIESDDTLNIRAEIEKYIIYWKWFLLGGILSLTLAFLYLRYTTPQFSAKAVILIKENQKGGISAEMKAFEDLGILGGSTNNIDNEIEIIKSRKIIGDVIKKLNYTVSYFSKGRVKESELYDKKSPILIDVVKKDSIFYELDTIIRVLPISNTEFKLISKEGEEISTNLFNEVIQNNKFIFRVISNSKLQDNFINSEIKIAIKPLNGLIDSYQKGLNISPVNKNSSVINLTLNDAVKNKAEDFLDTLILLYNEDAVADKNQVSEKTKNFIDDRLDAIGENLKNINNNLKNFKVDNKLTDIKAESELILLTLSENNKQIIESKIKLSLIQSLRNELKNQEGREDEILPASLVPEDQAIAKLISEYNGLILEKKRALRTGATKINAIVINLSEQIDGLKSSLNKSLQNSEKGIQLKLNQLEKENAKIKSKISGVPIQELELQDIRLEQEIISGLYSYLLKKKEETDISLAVTVANAKIIDKAYGSTIPVSPKKNIIYLAALLLGGLIPFVFIYIINLFDTKIHNKKDLEEVVSVPFLGDIPKSDVKEKVVIGGDDARSSTAEAFRLIRTNLDFMLANSKNTSNTIFVTSTTSGEGKSFISINIAASLALSGKKVLLLGMDLRAPKVTEYLGLPDRKGVTNYITDDELLLEDLKFNINEIKNLDIISSGVVPPNPAELLMTRRVENLFTIVKEDYDYVIVDTAPVNLVTDTLLIAKYADMFMYVARANYLDKRLLSVPQTLYKEKRLPNMAMILNDTDPKRSYGYGYGGYGYGYVIDEKPWYKKLFNKS
ncbi:GumC family protein [Polaribacter gochangensis]|uniref:GumC family protein n=1 Tax=Polaribacter gochangensis TaxID=3252903 RepID=UPI003904C47A